MSIEHKGLTYECEKEFLVQYNTFKGTEKAMENQMGLLRDKHGDRFSVESVRFVTDNYGDREYTLKYRVFVPVPWER